jgi:F0F1-type ATP synthase assembly protein I
MMTRPPHPSEQFRSIGLIYQLVGELVAPIVLGLVIDLFAKTGPWGTILGALVGVGLGAWRIGRMASRIGTSSRTRPPDQTE